MDTLPGNQGVCTQRGPAPVCSTTASLGVSSCTRCQAQNLFESSHQIIIWFLNLEQRPQSTRLETELCHLSKEAEKLGLNSRNSYLSHIMTPAKIRDSSSVEFLGHVSFWLLFYMRVFTSFYHQFCLLGFESQKKKGLFDPIDKEIKLCELRLLKQRV